MAQTIKDKIVVVPGGTGQIGVQIVENFLEHGAKKVVLVDINEDIGVKTTKNLILKYGDKISFIKCDINKDLESTSKKIIEEYGTIDVLINCAGVIDETNVRRCVDINLTSLIEWSLKFFDHMRTDKGGAGGTIINIASIYGTRTDDRLPTYTATKHGVLGFTNALGHNFKNTGVRTIVICPGYTITSLIAPRLDCNEFEKDLSKKMELYGIQQPNVVGEAVAEVFEKATTATSWIIEGSVLKQYN